MLERIHLEIIAALDTYGSLTKAAENLYLTQPALTHSIKKLEQLVGTKIWYKEGRDLKLTQSGKFLLKKAKYILPLFKETEYSLNAISQGKMGQFRIGVECHPCYEWLVGIIDGFLKDWPDVDIDVTRNFQFDGIEALLTHQVDLVITPDITNHDKLDYIPVIDFELLLVTDPGHTLADKKYIVASDLKDQTILTYPVPIERLDIYTSFLIPENIKPHKHLPIEATEIMLQLAATGRGVCTFPNWLVEKYSSTYNIKGVPMGEKGIQKKLYMVIRKEDSEISYIKNFINRGKEEIIK